MKNLLLIIVLAFFVLSCSNEKPMTSEVYVFFDISSDTNKDKDFLSKGLDEILNKMKISISEGGLSGGVVKFFLLNEATVSPYKTFTLKTAEGGFLDESSNKYVRGEEILKFKTDMQSAINTIVDNYKWDRPLSKIYQQLCREMNRMALVKADQKIVVLYSDMVENSTLFSINNNRITKQTKYFNKEVERWTVNKKSISNAYENILSLDCEFPNLNDVSFYAVSKRNEKNDNKIVLAEKFWARLFENLKAKQFIYGGELRFYE